MLDQAEATLTPVTLVFEDFWRPYCMAKILLGLLRQNYVGRILDPRDSMIWMSGVEEIGMSINDYFEVEGAAFRRRES